jgi:hypothetical protein
LAGAQADVKFLRFHEVKSRKEMPVCQHLKRFKSYLALVCLPLA